MTSSERLLLNKKEPILHNEGTNSSINWAEWNDKFEENKIELKKNKSIHCELNLYYDTHQGYFNK